MLPAALLDAGAARRLQHARLAAAEVPRPRAGELGGAARRDRDRRDAARDGREAPTPARIVDQQAVPILPDDTGAQVFGKVTVAAEQVLWRSAAGDRSPARRALRPNDLAAGQLLRRPHARGRPHRLARPAPQRPQPGARGRAALSGRVHRGRRRRGSSIAAARIGCRGAGRWRTERARAARRRRPRSSPSAATADRSRSASFATAAETRRARMRSQPFARPNVASEQLMKESSSSASTASSAITCRSASSRPPTGRSTAWTWPADRIGADGRAPAHALLRGRHHDQQGVDRVPRPQVRRGAAAGRDRHARHLRARAAARVRARLRGQPADRPRRGASTRSAWSFPSTSEVYGMCPDDEFDPETSQPGLRPDQQAALDLRLLQAAAWTA